MSLVRPDHLNGGLLATDLEDPDLTPRERLAILMGALLDQWAADRNEEVCEEDLFVAVLEDPAHDDLIDAVRADARMATRIPQPT